MIFVRLNKPSFASTGNELFSTGTLKPERILILNLEELQETLTSSVSSLLLETNYIDVVRL